jgi:hypothetical protein
LVPSVPKNAVGMCGVFTSRNHTHVAVPLTASSTAIGITSLVMSDVPSSPRMTTNSISAPTNGANTKTVTMTETIVGRPQPPSVERICQ